MGDDAKPPEKTARSPRSWITHAKNHNSLRHQINIKVSQEVNDVLREGAKRENLHIYEFIEKAVIFYCERQSKTMKE